MASSFLTRLRVGPRLVDARAVTSLYQSRVKTWQLVLLALVGLLAVAGAVAATPVGQQWWQSLSEAAIEAWTWAVPGRVPVTKLRYVVMPSRSCCSPSPSGIALGGGPLQGPIRGALQSQVEADGRERTRAGRAERGARPRASAAYDREFAEEVSPDLLGTALSARRRRAVVARRTRFGDRGGRRRRGDGRRQRHDHAARGS